jgi:hypothetical protein
MESEGIHTIRIRFGGMIHGFFGFLGIFDQAEQAHRNAIEWLKERFE